MGSKVIHNGPEIGLAGLAPVDVWPAAWVMHFWWVIEYTGDKLAHSSKFILCGYEGRD